MREGRERVRGSDRKRGGERETERERERERERGGGEQLIKRMNSHVHVHR